MVDTFNHLPFINDQNNKRWNTSSTVVQENPITERELHLITYVCSIFSDLCKRWNTVRIICTAAASLIRHTVWLLANKKISWMWWSKLHVLESAEIFEMSLLIQTHAYGEEKHIRTHITNTWWLWWHHIWEVKIKS